MSAQEIGNSILFIVVVTIIVLMMSANDDLHKENEALRTQLMNYTDSVSIERANDSLLNEK